MFEQKEGCFQPLRNVDCPTECPGRLISTWLPDEYGGEGYYIQVCPNPATLGQQSIEANYCGNGADVIVLFRNTRPTEEEYQQAINNFNDSW